MENEPNETSQISFEDQTDSSLDEPSESDDSYTPSAKKRKNTKLIRKSTQIKYLNDKDKDDFNLKLYECTKCKKKYTRKIFYLIHLKKYHSNSRLPVSLFIH